MENGKKGISFGKLFVIVAAGMALLAVFYAVFGNTAGLYFSAASKAESLAYVQMNGTWYQWDLEGEPVAVTEPVLEEDPLGSFSLSNQPAGLFLVAEDGTESQFQVEDLLPESIRVCADGSAVLGRTSHGELYLFEVKEQQLQSHQKIDDGVTDAAFTATKDDIFYEKGRDFFYFSGGMKAQIASFVLSLAPSTENQWIYYVSGQSEDAKAGQLVLFHVGRETVLDEEVTQVVYCGGGKALYLKSDGRVYLVAGEEITPTDLVAEDLKS